LTINESGNATFANVGAVGFELIFGSLISLLHEANRSPRAVMKTDNVMFFILVSLEEKFSFLIAGILS
jgi:hypothetical protein